MTQTEIKDWTETEKVILSRRSVRMYKNQQVPEDVVRRILEAGRFAPSAGNCQPWKYVVVRDKEIIDALANTSIAVCKNMVATLGQSKPPEPLHPTPLSMVGMVADDKFGIFHGAPTVILIFKDVRGVSNPDLDCGIAGQNMVLAAQSLGLGTCWVSFAGFAFQYVPEWNQRFGIEFPYEFVSSIAVGYPMGSPLGMVQRETHAVEWYENGIQKIVY